VKNNATLILKFGAGDRFTEFADSHSEHVAVEMQAAVEIVS
jgi:hypothetical protein